MTKIIEIELRSLFDKSKHDELMIFLTQHGKDLGEDDKNVFFFILPDKLIKVVDNGSKRTAKIVLKLNKIGLGSDFEEIEIPISPNDVEKSVEMFQKLGYNQMQESFQRRHNFLYKGIEIALKYSNNRGYHAELEILVDDINKKEEAEKRMFELAQELDIRIMTDEELKAFTEKIDTSYKK